MNREPAPHALRRRAVTVMVEATGSLDLTARAIGVTAATARGYYLDADRAFRTEEAFRAAAARLLPPAPDGPDPAAAPLTGDNP